MATHTAPTTSPDPTHDRQMAVDRIRKRREFTTHVVTYLVVNVALWSLWAITGAGYPWPAWVTGFWAIGLILNAWDVYFRRPITEAEIQAELRRGGPGVVD
jgi:hypothetical protein